jgi:hypothetical protein
MKKLSNVSPFLLLLFPVFVIMLLTISTATSKEDNSDLVTNKSNTPAAAIVKMATDILR